MIQRLLTGAVLLHQTCADDEAPEQPIVLAQDGTGLIVLSQEGREINVQLGTVRELVRWLRAQKATS